MKKTLIVLAVIVVCMLVFTQSAVDQTIPKPVTESGTKVHVDTLSVNNIQDKAR